jgi:hypothetical protein
LVSYSALESGAVAVVGDVEVVEVGVGVGGDVGGAVSVEVVVVSTRLVLAESSISFFNLRASIKSG